MVMHKTKMYNSRSVPIRPSWFCTKPNCTILEVSHSNLHGYAQVNVSSSQHKSVPMKPSISMSIRPLPLCAQLKVFRWSLHRYVQSMYKLKVYAAVKPFLFCTIHITQMYNHFVPESHYLFIPLRGTPKCDNVWLDQGRIIFSHFAQYCASVSNSLSHSWKFVAV